MTFNEGANLDTSQVTGGGKAGAVVGGGVGGLLLMLLVLFLGGNPLDGGTTSGFDPNSVLTGGSEASTVDVSQCKTGKDANENTTCRIVGTVNSVQDYWTDALPADVGREYRQARTVIYAARPSPLWHGVEPDRTVLLPSDERVYIDASFFDQLESQFGADGGNLAQMYVVAHEYGHHVENILGILAKAQSDRSTGPRSSGVRVELMADCLAGVWANHAASTQDAQGTTLLQPLTQADIDSALSAAAAVGDDHIQETLGGGRVNQDTWTHGSSESRQRWFTTGYESGSANDCNTFSVQTP